MNQFPGGRQQYQDAYPFRWQAPNSPTSQEVGLFRAGKFNRQIASIFNIKYSTIYYNKEVSKNRINNQHAKDWTAKVAFTSCHPLYKIKCQETSHYLRGITEISILVKSFSFWKDCEPLSSNQGFYARRPCKKPFISATNRRKG